MWVKIKTWFKENWKNFAIAACVPVAFTILILLFNKWLILFSWIAFLGILGYKIWKNKPF